MKIIIYGLGKRLRDQKKYLESVFEVVGYSDKSEYTISKYISPSKIHSVDCDAVYVTSAKHFEEIKRDLVQNYHVQEEKIVTLDSLLHLKEGSEERKKWVIEQLKDIPVGKTILDAGAGEMQFKKYCEHLKYIAQDFGQYDPKNEPGGVKGGDVWDTSKCDIISDIIDIPLDANSVDVILCTEVFEHLKNPILALKEFSRILKSGGLLILTAPFCSLTHMAPHFYYNGFSEYWYRTHLRENGFTITDLQSNGDLFLYFAWWLFRMDCLTRQYTDIELRKEEIIEIDRVVKLMLRLHERDCGSAESLCFGYNVKAKKEG